MEATPPEVLPAPVTFDVSRESAVSFTRQTVEAARLARSGFFFDLLIGGTPFAVARSASGDGGHSARTRYRGVSSVYAIVATGGKQYRVEPGQHLEVEKLDAEPGSQIEFSDVLLIGNGETVTIGQPTVAGARVVADVLGEVKGKKIVVFKYKSKVRYRRKTGHRQRYSRLLVKDIVTA